MTIHNPKSKAEWLTLRHKYISSTESAALKGLSPYTTAFELFHEKKQTEPSSFASSERMEWGLRMEEAIARSIAEIYGVKVRKLNAYVSKDGTGMGSSFDYEIVGVKEGESPADRILCEMYLSSGAGILEVKNVDWLVYSRQWPEVDGQREAPPHIEIQVQHQLHVIERKWAAIAVLVGGNSLKLLVREKDEEVGKALESASIQFWKDLKANKLPSPTLPQDAGIIAHLYSYAEPDKVLDAQGDSENARLLSQHAKAYLDAGVMKKAAEDKQKVAKAELLQLIGDAERVICQDGVSISAGMVAEAEVKAYTRAGYRGFRVNQKSKKETA